MTWSSPIELIDLFGDDLLARQFHLPGPGHGIQIQNGRLIIIVWHRLSIKLEPELREYGLSVLYSDDNGETWKNRFLESSDHLNEGRIAEVSPGKLKINARGIDQQRYQADSLDGGATWYGARPYYSIGTYGDCDSGFIAEQREGYTRLLTAHMQNDTTQRNNLWLYLSYDEGRTWSYALELWSNPELKSGTGASDITVVADGIYGVIHGTSWDDKQLVLFHRVKLSDLIGTDDETQVKHNHTGGEATYFKQARCAICHSPYGETHRLPAFILLPIGVMAILITMLISFIRRRRG